MKILFVFLLVIFVSPTIEKPSRSYVLKLVRQDTLPTQKNLTLDNSRDSETTVSHLSANRDPPVFLAKLSVGEPPVPQLLYVDTGSSFTWIKCGACNICDPQFQGYDQVASSTYKSVSCDDNSYESSPALSPVKNTGECHYRQSYYDGSESKGTLAKETIQFETDDDGFESVENVDFGCAHDITDGFQHGFHVGTGLLGLSYGKFSILNHFGNKFSICFEALINGDPNSGHSFLALGDGARTTGESTPLFMRNGHYHVELERININGRSVNIPNHSTPIGNTIVDTGSTVLQLASESYDEFMSIIDNILGHGRNSFVDGNLVCYNGTIPHELPSFPRVTLTFYKGASLELDPTSIFHQFRDDYFCLAVMRSIGIHLNIIGTTALQNYNLGFDVEDENIYMDKMSCDYLY